MLKMSRRFVVAFTSLLYVFLGSVRCQMEAAETNDLVRENDQEFHHEQLGRYRGCFRISRGKNAGGLMNRDCFIASHPDPHRLYWAVSGPHLGDPKVASGAAGFVGDFKIPDLSTLDYERRLKSTVMADPVENWHELLEDYRTHGDKEGQLDYARIGGIAYATTQKKLFVNFARYYHVQGVTIPAVAEFDPASLRRLGPYRTVVNKPRHASDINGSITVVDDKTLKTKGDLLSTAAWMVNGYGPRQSLLTFIGEDSMKWQPLIYHTENRRYSHASVKTPSGSGVFVGDYFVFPVRNGTQGWYGLADGYRMHDDVKVFEADEENWLPDLNDVYKGYHAPPYHAEIYSVPVTQLIEVADGRRKPYDCDYKVIDVTKLMFSYVIDADGRKQYRCNIEASLVAQGRHFFLLERNADTTQGMESGPVIHVFERDDNSVKEQ